jgi:hypothetical protein
MVAVQGPDAAHPIYIHTYIHNNEAYIKLLSWYFPECDEENMKNWISSPPKCDSHMLSP